MTELTTLDEIRQAAHRIRSVASRTPLLRVSGPGADELHIKCENLQPAGAFKIRGAYNMVSQLAGEQRARGVITYSSGNHGQAVALAARIVNAPAVIVMPTTAPLVKVEGARSFGADVIFEGTTSLDRMRRAEAEASERGLAIVPPFDHPMIIAGQGTAGLEILEQLDGVGTVVVPVGGGGLISGIGAAVKLSNPQIRVVGVEPAGAAKMSASLKTGQVVTLARTASLADGLLSVRPGELTFAHVRAFADQVVTVTEEAIERAVAWLFRYARLVVEPSGAVTVAAVLSGAVPLDPEARARGAMVAVLSGGNIAPELFARLITRDWGFGGRDSTV